MGAFEEAAAQAKLVVGGVVDHPQGFVAGDGMIAYVEVLSPH